MKKVGKKSTIQSARDKLAKKDAISKEDRQYLENSVKLFEEGKHFEPFSEGEYVSFEGYLGDTPRLICKHQDGDYRMKKSFIGLEDAKELINFLQNFVKAAE